MKKIFLCALCCITLFSCIQSLAEQKYIDINLTFSNFEPLSSRSMPKRDNELAWYFNLTGGNVSKTNILGIRPRLSNGQSASSYYIYKSLTQGAKRYYYKDTLNIHQGTEVHLNLKKDDRSKSKDALRIEAKFTP